LLYISRKRSKYNNKKNVFKMHSMKINQTFYDVNACKPLFCLL